MTGSRIAPPRPGPMIEALRGLGYSAPAALADLIDNSIAAGAHRVEVTFNWKGAQSTVSLLDDGHGMDDEALDRAMRLGELNPLDTRSINDLGRFGMGLKTASFSQARRLTVASVRDGVLSCLRWDLDALATDPKQEWRMLEGPATGSEGLMSRLDGRTSGTLVVWEMLDRIVAPGSTLDDFFEQVDRVEEHLAMVFHRFIEGPEPRLTLVLNGRAVKPWDPFLTEHPATWSSPAERLRAPGWAVEVVGHVLPHRDRLSEDEYKSAGGQRGWTPQQGFYIYRNERLLVAGGWLGLGKPRPWTHEEPFRLARIRLDLPNTADADWKLDIRKSRARPPAIVREKLTRIAEDVRDRARKVFAHRGQYTTPNKGVAVIQAWRTDHSNGGVRYRIDQDHPAVKAVFEQAGDLTPLLRAMLRVIEETVPVQRIWLDTAEAKETPRTRFEAEPEAEVQEVLETLFQNMVLRKGYSVEAARAHLLRTEPFNNFPQVIAKLALPGQEG